MPEVEAIVPISRNSGMTAKPTSVAVRIGDWASSFIAGPNSGEVNPSLSSQRVAFSAAGRGTFSSTILRPMSTRWPYCTPLGQVVSQLRQVRQRSRCSCVARVGCLPSSTCFIR